MLPGLAILVSPVTWLLLLVLYVGWRRLMDGPDPHVMDAEDYYWSGWPHHLNDES